MLPFIPDVIPEAGCGSCFLPGAVVICFRESEGGQILKAGG